MKKPKKFKTFSKEKQSSWTLQKVFSYKRKDAARSGRGIAEIVYHVSRFNNIENVNMKIISFIDSRYPYVSGLSDLSYKVLYDYWAKKNA